MANPNKTARGSGRTAASVAAVKVRMEAPSPMKDVMDAVSRGDMTPAEGARRVQEMMEAGR